MLAFVLHKGIVSPKIHRHRLSTVRAVWDEFCWNPHIFLLLYHLTDKLFIIISFLTARLAALKKSIVPLCIKQSFLIKSCLLETVIYIRCQHKIVLVPHRHRSQLHQPPQALSEVARSPSHNVPLSFCSWSLKTSQTPLLSIYFVKKQPVSSDCFYFFYIL